MISLGLNNDPAHHIPVRWLAGSGASMVRFPLRYQRNYSGVIRSVQAKGMEVPGIVTGEWMSPREKRARDYVAAFRRVRRNYPMLKVIQAGNEVDIDGPSSETRDKWDYEALIWAAREGLGDDIELWGAGLASTDDTYLDGIDLSCLNKLALHCWAQTGATVERRIAPYWRFGLPIVVTEFGFEHAMYAAGIRRWAGAKHYGRPAVPVAASVPRLRAADRGQGERARDVTNMIIALDRIGVEYAFFYAYSDRQWPGGLVDVHGDPYESYASFANAG